jgi:DNA-directed RNA polymerase subunit E'
VRARIIAVGFPKGGAGGKIGLTMRQPFLGRLDWIEAETKKEKD